MNNTVSLYKKGFSLVELLVTIAVIASVISLALPNFLGARSRARDAKAKGELNQVKSALQLYYNDYKTFPDDSGGPLYNQIHGCGVSGTSNCPCSATVDFAAGTGCANIYMTKLPKDLYNCANNCIYYYQQNSGADYCLKKPLENESDGDIATSQARCANVCSGLYSGSDYIICSD